MFVSHTERWEAECTGSGYQRTSPTPFKGYTVETISYPTVNITTDPNGMHLATFLNSSHAFMAPFSDSSQDDWT